jgi:beta-phosphoglucomutase
VLSATLFDYNGVLVDDEVVHLEAFRDVLGPLGVAVSERDYFERYLGFDDAGAFRAMLEDAGRPVDAERIGALIASKRPHYLARARGRLRAFEGAADLVRARANMGPVGIVSGALRDEIALGLELLGVSDVVQFVVSAEDTTASKPDPEGYRIAVARLGASTPAVIVVEDSLAGVEAAKAAGLACIAVAHSYELEQLRAHGADLVAPRIRDLTPAMFDQLSRAQHG